MTWATAPHEWLGSVARSGTGLVASSCRALCHTTRAGACGRAERWRARRRIVLGGSRSRGERRLRAEGDAQCGMSAPSTRARGPAEEFAHYEPVQAHARSRLPRSQGGRCRSQAARGRADPAPGASAGFCSGRVAGVAPTDATEIAVLPSGQGKPFGSGPQWRILAQNWSQLFRSFSTQCALTEPLFPYRSGCQFAERLSRIWKGAVNYVG